MIFSPTEFDVTEASTFPAGYKSECAINGE